MKCVILCAGKGSRLNSDVPKVLTMINGTPLIYYVIDTWKNIVDELIFVVGYRWQSVVECLPHKSRHIYQEVQKGIADAILRVESLVGGEKFVVALGDCVQKGTWELHDKETDLGISVWRTNNIKELNKNYLAELDEDFLLINRVLEKPNLPEGLLDYVLCGMGTYFFDKRVFDYIRKTPSSTLRNEVEITDTIQLMIDSGEKVSPFFFNGEYLNITYPEDIQKAEELLSE